MKCTGCGMILPDHAKTCPICNQDLNVRPERPLERLLIPMARLSQVLSLLALSVNLFCWVTLIHVNMGTSLGLYNAWYYLSGRYPLMTPVQVVFGLVLILPFVFSHVSFFSLYNKRLKGVVFAILSHALNLVWMIIYTFACEYATRMASSVHSLPFFIAAAYFVLAAIPCVIIICSRDKLN